MDPKCRHTCMHAPCIHTDLLPIVWHIHYMPLEGMKLCFLPWKNCPSPYVEKLPNFKGVIFGNGLKPCYHVLNNSIFWDTTTSWRQLAWMRSWRAWTLDQAVAGKNWTSTCWVVIILPGLPDPKLHCGMLSSLFVRLTFQQISLSLAYIFKDAPS